MIRNYLKIAWRNIRANKVYSIINIAGLSIGLSSFLLIATVVINEYSYDKQWSKGDHIFRITSENTATGEKYVSTPTPLGPQLDHNFDQVESYCRINQYSIPFVFKKDPVEINSLSADNTIWNFLDLKIVEGTPKKMIAGYNNLVLTQTIKDQFFPNVDPVGKIIKNVSNMGNPSEYIITGVIEDMPLNTHLRSDVIVIRESKIAENEFSKDGAVHFTNYQYLLLGPGVSQSSFTKAANSWYKKTVKTKANTRFALQAMKDIYLNSDEFYQKIKGNKRSINILTGVAILLLLIACINFVNLSTSRTIKKIRDTGLRKVLGASRKNLISQFLVESILFFSISYGIGVVIYWLFLPALEGFLEKPLALTFTGNFQLLLMSLGVIAIISLFTGIYPAWLISKPNAAHAVSNTFKTHRSSELFRKGLVVTQFVITVGIIISTLVVNNQLELLNQKDLGFNKENLLKINFTAWGENSEAFKKEIKKISGVEAASIGQWVPSSAGGTWSKEIDDPKSPNNKIKTWYIDADKDLFSTLELQLIDGRGFLDEYTTINALNPNTTVEEEESTESRPVLITAYTAERLNITELNKPYPGINGIPIGIVKNFHNQNLRNTLAPTIIRSVKTPQYGNLMVRVNTQDPQRVISKLAEEYAAFYPENLFNYSWIDADLAKEFRAENKLRIALEVFSLLIVFLSCLGLFGLITFMIQTRTKEISIRKVLGASIGQIVTIFSKDSLQLILLATLIAIPVAWYLLQQWLANFPYRIAITPLIFIQSTLVVILIALGTISLRIMRAALKNPAHNLRND